MTRSRGIEQAQHDGRPVFTARLGRTKQQGAVNPLVAVLALLLLLLSLVPGVSDARAQARSSGGAAATGLPSLLLSQLRASGAAGAHDLAASLAARGSMRGMTPAARRACLVAFQRDLRLRATVSLPVSCLSAVLNRGSASAAAQLGVMRRPVARDGRIGANALPPPGIIETYAGGLTGATGPPTSFGMSPQSVALAGPGHLLIGDLWNNVIWLANLTGSALTLYGQSIAPNSMSVVAGNGTSYGYGGDGGPATQAELTSPEGVAVDNAGNLYIADTNNYRIRKVTASSGLISTVAGGGNPPDGLGDGGPATQAELGSPYGVALDSAGNLYIADTNRIRKVTASTGIISTVAGNGSWGYGGDGGPATQAELYAPQGVTVDSAGNLYIADTNTNRVRVVGGSGGGGPTPTSTPTPMVSLTPTPTPAPLSVSITQVNDSRHGQLYPTGSASGSDTTVDGNLLTVHITINNPGSQSIAGAVTLSVAPSGTAVSQSVTVPAATSAYPVTLKLPTDGLAWYSNGQGVQPAQSLSLVASFNGTSSAAVAIAIRPRPVVLVHGLNDTYQTWTAWDQPGGFLELAGYQQSVFAQDTDTLGEHYGYPVDTMNTKTSPTKTTAQNAQQLSGYIELVRAREGADKVDLVAHSMGGLISRYYIANIMPGRVVTRLIMLGTPNAGSMTAVLGSQPTCPIVCLQVSPFSPQPATYENTPIFVLLNTDQQATARHGAHFFAIGGDIPVTSLCPSGDGWPSDLVVNHDSVRTVSVDALTYAGLARLSSPDEYQDMPVTHIGQIKIGPVKIPPCAAATDGAETTSPRCSAIC